MRPYCDTRKRLADSLPRPSPRVPQTVARDSHAAQVDQPTVIAGVLKSFNAAFLRERFFADCGIEEEIK